MMTSSLSWSTTLFLIISDFGRTWKQRWKYNIVHTPWFNSADVKIITHLHSKDLIFKVVFHSYDGSIWSFSYEAQNLTEQMQFVRLAHLYLSQAEVRGTLWPSRSGNVRCGNSGRKTELKSTSVVWVLVPAGSRSSGVGGPHAGGGENMAECPSLWVMESLTIERKPTLRRRSAAAPRFCGRHTCALKGSITQRIYHKHILYTFVLLLLLLNDVGKCGKKTPMRCDDSCHMTLTMF